MAKIDPRINNWRMKRAIKAANSLEAVLQTAICTPRLGSGNKKNKSQWKAILTAAMLGTAGAGLAVADYLDDGKINGSVFLHLDDAFKAPEKTYDNSIKGPVAANTVSNITITELENISRDAPLVKYWNLPNEPADTKMQDIIEKFDYVQLLPPSPATPEFNKTHVNNWVKERTANNTLNNGSVTDTLNLLRDYVCETYNYYENGGEADREKRFVCADYAHIFVNGFKYAKSKNQNLDSISAFRVNSGEKNHGWVGVIGQKDGKLYKTWIDPSRVDRKYNELNEKEKQIWFDATDYIYNGDNIDDIDTGKENWIYILSSIAAGLASGNIAEGADSYRSRKREKNKVSRELKEKFSQLNPEQKQEILKAVRWMEK